MSWRKAKALVPTDCVKVDGHSLKLNGFTAPDINIYFALTSLLGRSSATPPEAAEVPVEQIETSAPQFHKTYQSLVDTISPPYLTEQACSYLRQLY